MAEPPARGTEPQALHGADDRWQPSRQRQSHHQWWLPAERVLHGLGAAERPVYFVSSNTHSIVNVLSGTARRRKDELTAFIRARGGGAEGRTGAAGSRDEPLELGEPALLRGPTVLHQRRHARPNAGSEARKSRPSASTTSTPAARSTSASRSSSWPSSIHPNSTRDFAEPTASVSILGVQTRSSSTSTTRSGWRPTTS